MFCMFYNGCMIGTEGRGWGVKFELLQLCVSVLLCVITLGIMSSMNFCPPKPGSTVMTRAMSIWLAQGASSFTVVPGFMARPTCKSMSYWQAENGHSPLTHHLHVYMHCLYFLLFSSQNQKKRPEKPSQWLVTSVHINSGNRCVLLYSLCIRVLMALSLWLCSTAASPSCHSLWSPWWGFQGWRWPLSGTCTGWLLLQPWASPTAPAETPSCACLQYEHCHEVALGLHDFIVFCEQHVFSLTKERVFAYWLPEALHHGMAKCDVRYKVPSKTNKTNQFTNSC